VALIHDEDAMTSKPRAWIAAALATALTIGGAVAQTTPADPFAPGAAGNASEDAKPADKAGADSAKPSAPKRAQARRRKPEGGAIAVVIDNKRSVGLVQLTIGPAGGASPKSVAGPLAFGRKTTVHLKRTKDCLYDVRGHFADDADTEQLGVDLCTDGTINLTDE
jgi:hypothetical protein